MSFLTHNQTRQTDLGLLVLRIVGGGFMLTHGIPKLMKLLDGNMEFADPIGVGPTFSLILTVFAEVICAVFILVGYKTRLATIPLLVTMAVAAFIVHADDPWGRKEFGLLYFGIYLALLMMGGGRHSVDERLS